MSLNPRFVLECDKFCPVEPLPLSHQVADGDSQDKGIVRLKNSERPNTKPAVRKNRQFATGRGERKGPSFSKKPTDKSAIKLSNFRLNFTVPEQAEECAKAGSAVHLVGSAFLRGFRCRSPQIYGPAFSRRSRFSFSSQSCD